MEERTVHATGPFVVVPDAVEDIVAPALTGRRRKASILVRTVRPESTDLTYGTRHGLVKLPSGTAVLRTRTGSSLAR